MKSGKSTPKTTILFEPLSATEADARYAAGSLHPCGQCQYRRGNRPPARGVGDQRVPHA
jgi:hypothetical protein